MPFTYKLSPRAQRHFRESTNWYYEQSPDVAKDFVAHIEEGLYAICNIPVVQRRQYKNFSHFFLKKYPYTIIYTVAENLQMVLIRAIYHQKRNPRNKYR